MEKNRNEYIMNNVRDKYDYLIRKGYDVAAIFLQGSQNYKLDIYSDDYTSDIDCKAWIIPSLEDLVFGRKPVSTTLVLNNDEHIDLKDIRLVNDLLMGANPSYVELINTEYYAIGRHDILHYIDHKNEISNMNKTGLINAILGTFSNKKKAFKHVYPSRKEWHDEYGFDPKELHHMYRLFLFGHAIFESGKYFGDALVPNRWQRRDLLSLKTGENIFETVDKLLGHFILPEYLEGKSNLQKIDELVSLWENRLLKLKVEHEGCLVNVPLKKKLDNIVNNMLLDKVYIEAKKARDNR
jgi:hypothetical protein